MTEVDLFRALRDLEELEDELHRTNSENADRLTDIRSRLNGALIDEEIAAATGGSEEA
jgi:hypothetical protein